MNIETERKFLVLDSTYKAQAVKSYTICQGYIAHDSGNTVRVRIRDNQGFLTIKGPSADGISRQEWEREIPLQDARELFLLCKPGTIEKTRWIVPAGTAAPSGTLRFASSLPPASPAGPSHSSGHGRPEVPAGAAAPAERFFEVDEFHGDNEGLVMGDRTGHGRRNLRETGVAGTGSYRRQALLQRPAVPPPFQGLESVNRNA